MNDPIIALSDDDDPALRRKIGAVLARTNEDQIGVYERKALTIVVRDADSGDVVGGLIGRTSLGLLFIDLLALPPQLRGRRLGERLLETAEEEARRRGCTQAVLYTISFQAPDFHRRRGYAAFGEIASGPQGVSRIFMTKTLA